MKQSLTLNPESGPVQVEVEVTERGTTTVRFGNAYTLSELDGGELLKLQILVNDAVAASPRADRHLSQNTYAALVQGRHTPALRSFIHAMPIPVARALQAAVSELTRTKGPFSPGRW